MNNSEHDFIDSRAYARIFEEEKGISMKIRSELEPLLDGIRTKQASYELFKEAYFEYEERMEHQRKIVQYIVQGLFKKTHEVKDALHVIFVYLGLVETYGNSLADIIVLLLVANGRDFHIESFHGMPRVRHVVSIRDLERERVPLTAKLNFIRENGLKELASVIDSKLRNDIAHMKLEIRESKIFAKGRLAHPLAIRCATRLLEAITTTSHLLQQLATEKGLTKRMNTERG